jgi:Rrf2 family iron-sulfur cluster assembly transcriptional regulator
MPSRQLEVALEALCALATMPEDEALRLSVLSSRLGVSLSYLEAVFMNLRGGRLVDSQRGPGGGYRLALDPREITVAQVVMALGLHSLTGLREPRGESPAQTIEHFATEQLWESLECKMQEALSPICLADLMQDVAALELLAASTSKSRDSAG